MRNIRFGSSRAEVRQYLLKVVKDTLSPATSVAYLDTPSNINVGDSLLYAGARQVLRDLGIRVTYASDLDSYDPAALLKDHPSGPIVLNGGGNLGDRWGDHQSFRERVIKDFPERKLVVFPQSFEFLDPKNLDQAKQVFATHDQLVLLLREQESFEAAQREFAPRATVLQCPDTAFGFTDDLDRRRPAVSLLGLLRTDSEAVPRGPLAIPLTQSDWGYTGARRLVWRILRAPCVAARRSRFARVRLRRLTAAAVEAQIRYNLRSGVRTLAPVFHDGAVDGVVP